MYTFLEMVLNLKSLVFKPMTLDSRNVNQMKQRKKVMFEKSDLCYFESVFVIVCVLAQLPVV